eukprot:c23655_g1_i1 orf=285-1559(-)
MSSKTITALFQAHKKLRASEPVLGTAEACVNPARVACFNSGSQLLHKSIAASLKKVSDSEDECSAWQSKLSGPFETKRDLHLSLDSEDVNLSKNVKHILSTAHPDDSTFGAADDVDIENLKGARRDSFPLCAAIDGSGQKGLNSVGDDGDGVLKGKQLDLSLEQKVRMETNKAMACARRNLRLCEETVAEALGQGMSFPRLTDILVEKTWIDVLCAEFQKPYMDKLCQYVGQEAAGQIPIYPPPSKVFNAFNACPFDKVKVIIIGQDPYHGPGQAMGLCFSVEKGIKIPSSLVNIFKEIHDDLGCMIPSHGNLEKWAYQGVLLLNTVLTVREHHANSHAKKGWEPFTDAAIRSISQQRSGIVFLLWGNSAQEKIRLIQSNKHHILKAAHPSGLSAHRGFFNCRHFSQANKILEKEGSLPIDWQI